MLRPYRGKRGRPEGWRWLALFVLECGSLLPLFRRLPAYPERRRLAHRKKLRMTEKRRQAAALQGEADYSVMSKSTTRSGARFFAESTACIIKR